MAREQVAHHDHEDPADDHGRLRELVGHARTCLMRREIDPAQLLRLLARLRSELLEHFHHEETGGYFVHVIEAAPRLKDRVDVLLRQHPELRQRIDRLQDLARRTPPDEAWWEVITLEFSDFYDEFDEHERGETVLLQKAYTDDIGVSD
jgi:iron-sulfur cluster repair protein YtfE (RIC family)